METESAGQFHVNKNIFCHFVATTFIGKLFQAYLESPQLKERAVVCPDQELFPTEVISELLHHFQQTTQFSLKEVRKSNVRMHNLTFKIRTLNEEYDCSAGESFFEAYAITFSCGFPSGPGCSCESTAPTVLKWKQIRF